METLWQDLKYGARMLARNPGFTVVAVLTLALGIGANTAIFSVVNAVLLRPLPFPQPERLVSIWTATDTPCSMSAPEYFDFGERQKSFDDFGVFHDGRFGVNLTGTGEPVHVSAHAVTAEVFAALGVEPVLGRTFAEDEDQRGRNRVVILEHGLWLRQFGGNPSIVGRSIALNDINHTVVGVMPAGFELPFHNFPTDLWVPIGFDRSNPGPRTSYSIFISVGRLKPGVTREQAAEDIRRIARQLIAEHPDAYPQELAHARPNGVASLHWSTTREIRSALLILLGAVALVLLICCANVGNLLLSRVWIREREVAIRAALGAGPGRVVRQLLTESALLSFLGGLVGLGLAVWTHDLLLTLAPQRVPRLEQTGIDARVLAFAFGISALSSVFFGMVPALRLARVNLRESLQRREHTTGASGRARFQSALIVSELALSLILLASAGLLIRSFYNLVGLELGFQTASVLSFRLSPARSRHATPDQVTIFYEELLGRVRTLPGVNAAGAITWNPLSGSGRANTSFRVEGMPSRSTEEEGAHGTLRALWRNVTPGYFQTEGIGLLQGRDFQGTDSAQAPPVVIVDEEFARQAWPGQETVVGRRVAWPLGLEGEEERWRTVIGVVRNTKNVLLPGSKVPQAYLPHAQAGGREMSVVVKAAHDPTSLLPAIREAVASLDPRLALYEVATMDEMLATAVSRPRFLASLMGLFACLALGLAGLGIYGVLAYTVEQRTREIGIRMALGAQRREVYRLVVGQGLWLVMLGVTVGIFFALVLSRYLGALLYGVTPADPLTYVCVVVCVIVVALAGCYVPARRATQVDPMVALRYE